MPLFRCLTLIALLTLLSGAFMDGQAAPIKQDKQSAIILAYHRVGEDTYPDTNIRVDQFEQHINELINNDYNVIPLQSIIDALDNDEDLPPKTIAITFEGAYKSAFEKAIPILNRHNIPYTVFYASDLAGANTGQYMNWQDLHAIKNSSNGALGILPASYIRLTEVNRTEAKRLINSAIAKYRETIDKNPTLFSIPFGEWNEEVKTTIEEYKFQAIFGHQSGVFYKDYHQTILPRFSITENYADSERLSLILNALPLPLNDVTRQNSTIGFTLDPELQKKNLRCYSSGGNNLIREELGDNRIELKLENISGSKKTRINCTLPENQSRWRWAGFILPPQPTSTPEETEEPNNNLGQDELPQPQEQNDEAYSQSQP